MPVAPQTLEQAVERLLARDPSLFDAHRMGWLEASAARTAPPSVAWPRGCDRALLLGMGGSSMAAHVYGEMAARHGGGSSPLTVLDSSVPAAIRRHSAQLDPRRTCLVAVSKSGATVETLALLSYFAPRFAAEQILCVTDPGTALAATAYEKGWAVLASEPTVGGRFSALATSGLVAATLAGVDLDTLRAAARNELAAIEQARAQSDAAQLAQRLAAHAYVELDAGRAATIFGWIEQLVAESTGKNGHGVLPIVRAWGPASEPASGPVAAASFTERIDAGDVAQLGRLFVRWQVAVTIASAVIGVNPFDEPDVAAAKTAALASLNNHEIAASAFDAAPDRAALHAFVLGTTSYLAVLAYADPSPDNQRLLDELCQALQAKSHKPVTAAFGPRYLHSTGQLHKGGPGDGRFALVVVDDAGPALSIPGQPFTFGELTLAQAAGDATTLRARGRNVLAWRAATSDLRSAVKDLWP